MKSRMRIRNWTTLLLAGAVVATFAWGRTAENQPRDGYTAHEWGTFTSVQGGDGVLLDWRPLLSADLPGFVHDWTKPGGDRQSISPQLTSKARMVTLQRMETPVIYFYSELARTINVTVDFPKGLITEWYPQAQRIGPSRISAGPMVRKLDAYARQLGARADFSFAGLLSSAATPASRATWDNVKILLINAPGGSATLPQDASGRHYFAARETEANCIQVRSGFGSETTKEREKFIFYRGAGSFPTPLHAQELADRSLILENQGEEALAHLFVLSVDGDSGQFFHFSRLASGERLSVSILPENPSLKLPDLARRLGIEMAKSLVEQGLYLKEAEAMVETWKDSWFAEPGVRVLYLLPPAWTERTLPLRLDPAPTQVARVMVGRTEIIGSQEVRQLSVLLSEGAKGDLGSQQLAEATLIRFGRFAEPALQLATDGTSAEIRNLGYEILQRTRTNEVARR